MVAAWGSFMININTRTLHEQDQAIKFAEHSWSGWSSEHKNTVQPEAQKLCTLRRHAQVIKLDPKSLHDFLAISKKHTTWQERQVYGNHLARSVKHLLVEQESWLYKCKYNYYTIEQ